MCHNIGYSNLSTIYREYVVLKETDRLAIGDLGISLFFGTELSRTFCAQYFYHQNMNSYFDSEWIRVQQKSYNDVDLD